MANQNLEIVKVGNLGQVITGKTPPTIRPELYGDVYPFITPTDISDKLHTVKTARFLSGEGFEFQKNLLIPPKSVCYTCIASIGKICITTSPSFTNQQINTIIVNQDKYDYRFVYYLLIAETERIKKYAGGAAAPIINKSAFSEIKVLVPDLPTQRRIANILSAYDDLIENNTRRIRILEQMVQAIYQEWFGKVDKESLPKGWELQTLGDVAENFDSKRVPLSSMKRAEMQGKYPYYGAAKIFDYVNDYIFDGKYLLMAEDGSVITTDGKPVLQMAYGKIWVNNHTHVLQGIKHISTEYLYLCLSNVSISGYITGAAQPKVTQANLNRIPVVVPPNDLLAKFNKIFEETFDMIETLNRKNINLRQTRDLLLPRLVSDEIEV